MPPQNLSDVPLQVFETFLKALADDKVPAEIIDGLRQSLIVDRKFNEAALRAAIFGDEEAP